jgi:predicted phage-related endonuclease
MKKITLEAGSLLWLTARSASKAATVMGFDKKTSRNELMHIMNTGIGKEFSDWAQKNLLDKGNHTEHGARALAEEIIGDDLISASFATDDEYMTAAPDGITFDGNIGFEAKTWNEKLAESVRNNDIPDTHWPQLEQQIFVCGLDYVLFMVSDGTRDKTVSMEYRAVPGRIESIIAAWHRFDIDRANYVHVEVIDAPEADAIQSLPAVTIQVSGEMTLCNLDAVTPKFDAFLEKAEAGKVNISINNGDAIAKFSRAAAVDCKLTAKSVVSQMATVSEAVTKLELYAKKFDAMGLAYEKEVDRLKEIEKVAALNKAKAEYADHVAGLQEEVKPIVLVLPPVDFQLAIKGLKTVESKNNALNTALANGKIAADAIAADIRKKLAWCKENAAGQSALFPDLQTIIYKPYDDFTLLITSRIEKQKADEAARVEAQRVAMQAAADAKAKAEADAILAAERKKVEAEQAAIIAEGVKAQLEAQAAQLERKAENDAKETNPSPAPRTGAAKEEVAPEEIEAREMLRTFYERFAHMSEFSIIIDAIEEYQSSL